MNCHTKEVEVQQIVKLSGGLEKLGLDRFLARLMSTKLKAQHLNMPLQIENYLYAFKKD